MITFSEEGRIDLLKAFAAAQSEMDAVIKDAENTFFQKSDVNGRKTGGSPYATLAAVRSAVMPALNKNGLALIQSTVFEDDYVAIETIIAHTSGGMMSNTLRLKPSKTDPQGLGSTITYGRRYAMMSMCGVAPEDDDANAGSLGSAAKKVPVQTSAQAKKDGLWEEIEKNFRSLTSMERLDKGMAYYGEKIPAQWRGSLADLYEDEAKRIKSLADEPPIGQEPKQESKSENPFEGE